MLETCLRSVLLGLTISRVIGLILFQVLNLARLKPGGGLLRHPYFEKYPLKSKKRLSFEKWQKIAKAIKAKKHLVTSERIKLVALSKEVNPKIDLKILKVFKPLSFNKTLAELLKVKKKL